MPVSYNNGRFVSKVTVDELSADLKSDLDKLTPDERATLDQILAEIGQSSDASSATLQAFSDVEFKSTPVDLKTFIFDEEYLGTTCDVLYPKLFADLQEIFVHGYQEAVFTGSIGFGKSFASSIGICYILYQLSLLRDPQKSLGLAKGSYIDIVVFSVTAELAKKVAFDNIVTKIMASPYFIKNFPFEETKTELRFPNNIRVAPRSTTDNSALGLNVFSAFLDESDFMGIKKNKKTVNVDISKAESIYNTIKRRMKSRFQKQGKLPGVFFIASSKNTTADFSAKLLQQAIKSKDPTVFVRDYATWDVKNEQDFSGNRFCVLVGNEQIESKILSDDEAETYRKDTPDGCVLLEVPEDYRIDFVRDLDAAVRDIGGVATISVSPFIQKRESILKAIETGKLLYGPQYTHPFTVTSFEPGKEGQFIWERLVAQPSGRDFLGRQDQKWRPLRTPGASRHIHIDPSFTNDKTGICMAHVSGYKQVVRKAGDGSQYTERAPVFVVDFMLQIIPPTGSEIMMGDVRQYIYDLSQHGFIIGLVTSDTYQSRDGLQILNQKGYNTEAISVDKTMDPYECLKLALYEERLIMYDYAPLNDELIKLQRDLIKRKVDHPPGFGKDVSDALAGCLYTLSQNVATDPLPILKSSDSGSLTPMFPGLPSTNASGSEGWHDLVPAFLSGSDDFGTEN